MAQEIINLGALADDGTGDTIRIAGTKINSNFTELFATSSVESHINVIQNNITTDLSNADIDLKPSGTGAVVFPGITIDDNNIKATSANNDLKFIASGSGSVVIAGIGFSGTSIIATDSSSVNINENLIVDGTLITTGSMTVAGTVSGSSGSTIGNLILANGSITDSSGTISFGNENLTTTGTLSAETGSVIGNMTFADGSITDSSGTISFGNENLTTSGNLNAGTTTLGSMTVSGSSSFVGTTTIDNLTFNDNIISTSSNADLNLSPGGTGVVNVSNLTIDSDISLTDNVIKLTRSNDNWILSANGSGTVVISNIGMNQGAVDNTVIGGTTPAAGTFTTVSITNPVVIADGVTITDNKITANRSNDNVEFKANGSGYVKINGISLPNSDGQTGQVLRTDGSKQLSWITSPVLLGASDIQDNSTTISFSSLTEIDRVTAVGSHDRIESGTVAINDFTTSQYDSAWYLAVNRDDASDEFEVVKHSVAHNNTDAFLSTSVRAQTGTNNQIQTTADISDGLVRLLGTGSSPENSVTFYRIGLGDDDSTGIAGEDESSIVINIDIDSASEVVDTWAKSDYRGAKYYISVNNASKTEVSNLEVLVVHDGTTAYTSVYNVVNTGNNDLVTITAAVDGSNVKLSAAGLEPNIRLHAYRIILADDEADRSSANVNVIGEVTVSSASTTLDTFSTGSYQAAHYVVVGYNSTEGAASICEAAVVSDGTTAFISQYGQVSTKGTDQITLSASHASTTTTVSATSTSGGSTVVNAYRVNLARGAGASTAVATLDSVSASTYRVAKYNVQVVDANGGNYELFEANVVHDGSTAYVSTFGNVGNTINLITVTADINGGNLRLRGTINNTNDHQVKVIRRVIEV
tara:strand:+ start:890 stop:3496 length:2607 start_codon:yes stop_codon:yes gene_type:complete